MCIEKTEVVYKIVLIILQNPNLFIEYLASSANRSRRRHSLQKWKTRKNISRAIGLVINKDIKVVTAMAYVMAKDYEKLPAEPSPHYLNILLNLVLIKNTTFYYII